MRRSLKIRDAKRVLPTLLEDTNPIHFGDAETYLDYILCTLIHLVHGNIDNDSHLLIYYEYKVRVGEEITNHYEFE